MLQHTEVSATAGDADDCQPMVAVSIKVQITRASANGRSCSARQVESDMLDPDLGVEIYASWLY